MLGHGLVCLRILALKYASQTSATDSTRAMALNAFVHDRTMSFRIRMVASAELFILCPRVVNSAWNKSTHSCCCKNASTRAMYRCWPVSWRSLTAWVSLSWLYMICKESIRKVPVQTTLTIASHLRGLSSKILFSKKELIFVVTISSHFESQF